MNPAILSAVVTLVVTFGAALVGAYLGTRAARQLAGAFTSLEASHMADQAAIQQRLDKLSGDVQALGSALTQVTSGVTTEIQTLTAQNQQLAQQLAAAKDAAAAGDSDAVAAALDQLDSTVLGYTNSVSSLVALVTPGTPATSATSSGSSTTGASSGSGA